MNQDFPLALVDVHLTVSALVARLAVAAVVVDQVLAGASIQAGQQLTVVNVLCAVPSGVARKAVAEVVSDFILTCPVFAWLGSTLVDVDLTGLAFQSCLTLALKVVYFVITI